MFRVLLLLFFIAACVTAHADLDEIKKRLKNRKSLSIEEMKLSQEIDEENLARLLKVDYWFRTESMIYDSVESKDKAPSTVIAGNFTFDTLHHDIQGSMLGRFTLTQCNTNNCGDPSPVYIAFTQGGNNVIEVLASDEKEATWNFLYAIINTIYTPAEYGEGDMQVVDTVYGRCKVHFGRPEDKRFRRITENCDIGPKFNFTKFEGIEKVEYSQDVWYTQNTKVDADIIMIDAIELLSFRSPFHEKHGFQLESRTHVEITNRTRVFIHKHCDDSVPAAQCAKDAFGARKVGDILYENVKIASKSDNQLVPLIEKFRSHLQDMGDSHICEQHSQLFAQILQEARLAKKEDWVAVLNHPENDHVLSVVANALGSVGTVESLEIVKDVFLKETTDHFDDVLFGISQVTSNNEKYHKQLMYWLASLNRDTEEYWKLANTIATVLRKRCEATTSSLNSCNKGKELIVTKFINDLIANGVDSKVLEVLENLPVFASYDLATKHICTTTDSLATQKSALRVILAANKNLYDTQMSKKLMNVFRNTCPQMTPTTHSQLAIDILLRCVPEQQNVATMILRTETLNPIDQEKWQYLYRSIEEHGEIDELKAEFWHRMRQFKVFRPNYLHRALQADSHAHWLQIAESSGFKLFSKSSSEFFKKSFKRSDVEISMKKGKKEENVFSISIDTNNLEHLVVPDHSGSSGPPEASVRIGVLGHKLPGVSVFKGNGDLLSTVWDADGRSHKVFEGHVGIRDNKLSLPLLSGLTVDVSSVGALTLRVLASGEVSLWDQKFTAKSDAYSSGSLHLTATLSHHQTPIRRIESTLSVLSSFSTNTNAIFTHLPYDYCLKSSQSKTEISQTTVIQQIEQPRKKLTQTRKRILPGVSYRLDDTTTNQCNNYLNTIRQ